MGEVMIEERSTSQCVAGCLHIIVSVWLGSMRRPLGDVETSNSLVIHKFLTDLTIVTLDQSKVSI
jgi:hypothetical protein